MIVYVSFDDTDNRYADRGTGKLVRFFAHSLPDGMGLVGVVRQQLLVDPAIPYTSHNSAACAIVYLREADQLARLTREAIAHIEKESLPGSDPGLCIVMEQDEALNRLIAFGKICTSRVVTQEDAFLAAQGVHLSGHGGTCGGVIGAAAGAGLTAWGWSGRFIEYGSLRKFPDPVPVGVLEQAGIRVVSLDRDSVVPDANDMVHTKGWLRPRLLAGKPVLAVLPGGDRQWESMGEKRKKQKGGTDNECKNILP